MLTCVYSIDCVGYVNVFSYLPVNIVCSRPISSNKCVCLISGHKSYCTNIHRVCNAMVIISPSVLGVQCRGERFLDRRVQSQRWHRSHSAVQMYPVIAVSIMVTKLTMVIRMMEVFVPDIMVFAVLWRRSFCPSVDLMRW